MPAVSGAVRAVRAGSIEAIRSLSQGIAAPCRIPCRILEPPGLTRTTKPADRGSGTAITFQRDLNVPPKASNEP